MSKRIEMPDVRFSFRVHIWDEDRALVTCVYNCIIGSCWLASVDAATVPGVPR